MRKLRANGLARPSTRPWVHDAASFCVHCWRPLMSIPRITWVFVAARHRDNEIWIEHCFQLREASQELRRFFEHYPRIDYDLYWCPNGFRRPKRTRKTALSTPFAWCDIDRADWRKFKPVPPIVWSTSPGRTQGLWRWTRFETPGSAEAYSRALAYRFGGDRNGWSITKYLRIPHTYNHKRAYQCPKVEVVRFNRSPQLRRPRIASLQSEHRRRTARIRVTTSEYDWREVVARYKERVPIDRYWLMNHTEVRGTDRSQVIFLIVQALHAAKAKPAEIAAVVWRSPYFISKHGRSHRKLEQELSRIIAKLESGK